MLSFEPVFSPFSHCVEEVLTTPLPNLKYRTMRSQLLVFDYEQLRQLKAEEKWKTQRPAACHIRIECPNFQKCVVLVLCRGINAKGNTIDPPRKLQHMSWKS